MTTQVQGTLTSDGTLVLDAKPDLPAGRVRLRIESMEVPEKPKESLVAFVQRNRRELEAVGHRFRTKEEIDAELQEMRDEWDEPEKPGC
jgi:hypothetical protein